MKGIITCTILLLVGASLFGQSTKTRESLNRQDYLGKSKKQKKTAWILLAGGAAFTTTAFLIPEGEQKEFNPVCLCYTHENDGISAAFFITGGLSMLGSIPFFIASGRNKRKALSLSFKYEKAIQLHRENLVYTSFPALMLTMRL
jgi:hypothetical protein